MFYTTQVVYDFFFLLGFNEGEHRETDLTIHLELCMALEILPFCLLTFLSEAFLRECLTEERVQAKP